MNLHKPTLACSTIGAIVGIIYWATNGDARVQDWHVYLSGGVLVGAVISIHFANLLHAVLALDRCRFDDAGFTAAFVGTICPILTGVFISLILTKIEHGNAINVPTPMAKVLAVNVLLWSLIHLVVYFKRSTAWKHSTK